MTPLDTGYPAGLTARQIGIMDLLGQGFKRIEIAKALAYSEALIGKEIRSVRDKLHCRTNVEAAVKLARAGLIGPKPEATTRTIPSPPSSKPDPQIAALSKRPNPITRRAHT